MNKFASRMATRFSNRWTPALVGALLLASYGVAVAQPVSNQGSEFLQGPEKVGEVMAFSGTVMGIRNGLDRRCHILRVDRKDWPPGMGAGGRAVLCSSTLSLEMGQMWKGSARQTGIDRLRMGAKLRRVPRFDIP